MKYSFWPSPDFLDRFFNGIPATEVKTEAVIGLDEAIKKGQTIAVYKGKFYQITVEEVEVSVKPKEPAK